MNLAPSLVIRPGVLEILTCISIVPLPFVESEPEKDGRGVIVQRYSGFVGAGLSVIRYVG